MSSLMLGNKKMRASADSQVSIRHPPRAAPDSADASVERPRDSFGAVLSGWPAQPSKIAKRLLRDANKWPRIHEAHHGR